MPDAELIRELLEYYPWRCVACGGPATRAPIPKYTRSVHVFRFKHERTPLLFLGGTIDDARVKAQRVAKKYGLTHWGLCFDSDFDRSLGFCDAHGFEGIYACMKKSFELQDDMNADMIRRAVRRVNPNSGSTVLHPTRFERILTDA